MSGAIDCFRTGRLRRQNGVRVEGDREIRGAIRSLLEASGHRAEEYSTADAFLEAIAADPRRGCVVTGCRSPGEGDEAASWCSSGLQADGVDLPGLLSSRAAMRCRSRCGRCEPEPSDFLQKPFEADRLLVAVDPCDEACASSAAAERQSEIAESTAHQVRHV